MPFFQVLEITGGNSDICIIAVYTEKPWNNLLVWSTFGDTNLWGTLNLEG